MQWAEEARVYRPRKPKQSPLWQLLSDYFYEFEERYEELFSDTYGFFRPVINRVIGNFLECGDLQKGFARVRCFDCHHEYLLAFSCRGRYFCPSCHTKKVVQFGEHLLENVLFPVPHNHYVFSIPKILRHYFRYDRKLLGKLSGCAAKSLTVFLKIILDRPDGVAGMASAIQTFGDYGRWHPHIHTLAADGLFTERGYFYVLGKTDLDPLEKLFRAEVLNMLLTEGRIKEELVKKLLKWRYNSGFSIHRGKPVPESRSCGGL